MGDQVTLVSSAEECAKDVYKLLVRNNLAAASGEPSHQFLTTGRPDEFESIGRRFLGPELHSAGQFAGPGPSSEARRGGKECVSQCMSRWLQAHYKKKQSYIYYYN